MAPRGEMLGELRRVRSDAHYVWCVVETDEQYAQGQATTRTRG